MSARTYGDCIHCGGQVAEKQQTLDYRHHGQLFIMENVPVGVCAQCGERFLVAEIAKKLEQAASNTQPNSKMVAVPVVSIAA